MVTQGMEYKVVVQPVVFLEAVPVGGDIVAAKVTHELTAGGVLDYKVG